MKVSFPLLLVHGVGYHNPGGLESLVSAALAEAGVDRVWARWQTAHNNAAGKPTNGTEILQPNPSPIFQGKRVSQVLKITTLGYRYA